MDQRAAFITPEIVKTFDRTGAVLVRGLLSPEALDLLKAGLDEMIAAADDYSDYYSAGEVTTTSADAKQRVRKAGAVLTRQNAWEMSAPMRQFLAESPLAHAATALMQSTQARLYEDLMIFKAAGTEKSTPWHQDEPQWPLVGRQMCSAWFCLDPVTSTTGALRFVAGSHKGPRYRPYVAPSRAAELNADEQYFEGGPLPDVDADPQRYETVCHDTQPGDVVFFHPRSLHAAIGSAPDYPRRTFSIRFLGDDVRWLPKKSVMYEWLARIPLQEGDRITGEQFPVLWPRKEGFVLS